MDYSRVPCHTDNHHRAGHTLSQKKKNARKQVESNAYTQEERKKQTAMSQTIICLKALPRESDHKYREKISRNTSQPITMLLSWPIHVSKQEVDRDSIGIKVRHGNISFIQHHWKTRGSSGGIFQKTDTYPAPTETGKIT